jgi:hypothetical protein
MNKTPFDILPTIKNQKGVSAVIIAICLFVLIGFVALAFDLGHLFMVKNELQNAADAGALAGAANLYDPDGDVIRTDANQIARDTAIQNTSEGAAVKVDWTSGTNGPDVQRGHWGFQTVGPPSVDKSYFIANSSTTVINITQFSTEQLNAMDAFINAVRVRVQSQPTSVVLYFARIFGFDIYPLAAEAVAYLGYAGDLGPGEVDWPIALCENSIKEGGILSCNIGRMINSGSNPGTHNTAGWTNFEQSKTGEDCDGIPAANKTTIEPLIIQGGNCSYEGNPKPIILGNGIAATNGQVASLLQDDSLYGCWKSAYNEFCSEFDASGKCIGDERNVFIDDDDTDTLPDQPWKIKLPVIDCGPDGEVGNCMDVVGAVTVKLVWINDNGNDPQYKKVLSKMDLDDPTYDWVNDVPIYSDTWPNDPDIKGTSSSATSQILDIIINEDFTNGDSYDPTDDDSILTIMESYDGYDQVKNKLDGKYGEDVWKTMTLGQVFYEDPGSPETSDINNDNYEGMVRWASFVKTLGLKNVKIGGVSPPAPYQKAAVYFQPDCDPAELSGNTGGENFGILADDPVLVYHGLLHEVK